MKLRSVTTIILLSVFGLITYAQQMAPLPIDPQVKYGKLENGLTYYIRHNAFPKNRAEFYIAQNVGSILENDSQRGLAHFLEHMAFNGSKNFPGKSMLNYLESNGVKFGTDVNAYTSFDETVYNISNVPVNREGIVDSCLLILHDWSNAIALEDKEIDEERGVIREEWRTRTNANMRILAKLIPQVFAGSQYANRMPIGTMDIVMNFPYQTLKDYYHKWYRPDLQGIIIVGDIDADKTEKKLKEIFNTIPKPENAAERIYYTVPDNKEPIIAIAKDKEATGSQVTVYYKHKPMTKELKATIAGHIYNIQIEEDLDNGSIVAKGDYIKPETYKAKDSTGFAGVVLDKAANGNWYVEVKTPGDALLLLQVPMLYEEYTTALKHESNFYNANGDIVRAYELYVGDVFEVSSEGFSGTPTKGATVTVADKKLTIG